LNPLTAIEPENEIGSAPDPEVEFNFAEYIGMVRRHWKLVAAASVVGVLAAAAHYAVTPREYLASSTIQIERRNLAPVGNAQNSWYENLYNVEFYPTQYELLQSRGLAERVVKSLDLMSDRTCNPGAAAPRGLKAGSAEGDDAALGGLAGGLLGGLSVDPVRNTQLVRISYRAKNPDCAARLANGFAESFIDMGVEDRYASAGRASNFLATQIDQAKEEIEEKQKQLSALSKSTDIVTLDPQANVTLQRLEQLNNDYMAQRKARIEKESRYREILNAPKESLVDSLSAGVVADLRAEQSRLEREYDTKLKTFKPDYPDMVDLKSKIEKGREHLNQAINEQVAKAKSEALGEYQTSQRQEEALSGELTRWKGETINQNSAAVQYQNLKMEIDSRRSLLNDLLQRQSETEVAVRLQDTRQSNIRIIDKALVPGGPFRPLLRKDLSYGLLLGLLLGVACAVLIEFLDRTIKTPEELERRLSVPTLAVIQDVNDPGKSYGYSFYGYSYGYGHGYGYGSPPAADEGQKSRSRRGRGPAERGRKGEVSAISQIELTPHDRPRTLIAEAYRSLRTALLLSSASELKVIAVTSATAGEGKTATASNLAVVLAQLGRRTVIVDCDLRKPRLHQVFRVSNRSGVVTQLTGGDGELPFLATQVPNLWIVPSGPIPPNPSELLSSDRMREWIRALRGRFDYVVIDTPPVLAVADAVIAGQLVDGVVMTLCAGKVMREDARQCRDRLRQAGIKVLGAVLNRHRTPHVGLGKRYRYYEAYGMEEGASKAGSAA
jgi:capsular exopolysaccharide synthesis family protein